MTSALVRVSSQALHQAGLGELSAIVAAAGEAGSWRFVEFFTANIRNKNTRMAYLQAILAFLA